MKTIFSICADLRKFFCLTVWLCCVSAVAQQQHPDLLPRQSAGNWGGQLGGAVMGEVMRDAGTGSRGVDRALAGIATEVGRNAGRQIFQSPYGDAQQQRSGQQRAYTPLNMRDVDQMDTLSLRAAFSYERLIQATSGKTYNSAQFRQLAAPFDVDMANLKATYRILEREGKDVRPWDSMYRSLSARFGSISMSHLHSEGVAMLERLQRPGGPGYVDVPQTQTLDGLRQQMGVTTLPGAE